jgi:hypothetical protein
MKVFGNIFTNPFQKITLFSSKFVQPIIDIMRWSNNDSVEWSNNQTIDW